MSPRRQPAGESHEEARALLQARVALFWKVMTFIMLLSVGLGAAGAIAEPGLDLVLTSALSAQGAVFWWLSARGQPTFRMLRVLEGGGLLLNLGGGALLGRIMLAGFAREHALVTTEGTLMADAYLSMLQLSGTGMMVAIRAALIPSSPRRTVLVTTMVGAPLLLTNTLLVPTAGGAFTLRALDSPAYPWLPLTAAMMWGFAIITCTVISWVIYGLQAEVREARQLGQYVLESKLGEGGMGEVYRASHGMMRRPSALKLLRSDRTAEADLRRFEREVQLTARLTHPNTITIFDFGRTQAGIFYYAMELLDGANLQRVVSVGGAQAAGRVVRVLTMACGALSEAHGIGLIHRDIKPANIMLCAQGGELDVVKLLDFGLVKEVKVDRAVQLTGESSVAGTPQYMAPESILDPGSVDERTDIYALGAVAYYLLAGGEVFRGKSVVEVCSQHLHQQPEVFAARAVAVPAALEALVMACLEKNPDRRPQSAAELRQRLSACAVEPWRAEDARNWWRQHEARLQSAPVETEGEPRTVAVHARRAPA
jgi:eukaryotic-like serine/threonine-protein kinase